MFGRAFKERFFELDGITIRYYKSVGDVGVVSTRGEIVLHRASVIEADRADSAVASDNAVDACSKDVNWKVCMKLF